MCTRGEMREKSAVPLEQLASRKGAALSAHATYFTDFDTREPEERPATQETLLHALRVASLYDAEARFAVPLVTLMTHQMKLGIP